MAGSAPFFRLFLVFLVLSHLICLKAIPVTRTQSLTQSHQVHLIQENTNEIETETDGEWEDPSKIERMDLQLHDYPPSGANGHHTPRAP